MSTNLIKALANLKNVKNFYLPAYYGGANRINNVGVALEYFIKDILCDSLEIKNLSEKDIEHSKYLSYIGNTNNPPDFIIKKGDAFEVKKIQNLYSGLALNSSYPKNQLYSNNPLITKSCRECENWSKKDIVYVIGVIKERKIRLLWFVYGDCYAADRDIYEGVRNKIITGIQSTSLIEFSKTKELGRVNRVDPLGITYLRVRGMWGIENPLKVFDYLNIKTESKPLIVALMRETKFNSFSNEDKNLLEDVVEDVKIKDPDNPAKFLKAKIIKI
jgi:hypothetical protein